MQWFKTWRRGRILKRSFLDADLWRTVLGRYPFTRGLSGAERARLHDWVVLFLHEKSIVGAGGLETRDEMRISIAVQACMLILNLDLDFYRGWVEVIVYPGEFVAKYDYMDDDGIAHHIEEPMTGESWLAGPVILSWADTELRGDDRGYNVVIHEFAHKLDMLNGDANGFPPLHADMDREEWSRAFSAAYEHFSNRVERGEPTGIDPYGAENPGEFFAVLSEAFFEIPDTVLAEYAGVYRQLAAFYRQDPAARVAGAVIESAEWAAAR
jgi:Mlc titration factor MtfA (ptsG expression regulator)